jgi:hypothetical protein
MEINAQAMDCTFFIYLLHFLALELLNMYVVNSLIAAFVGSWSSRPMPIGNSSDICWTLPGFLIANAWMLPSV